VCQGLSVLESSAPNVLLVDDSPRSLQIFSTVLNAFGWQVAAYPSPHAALKVCQSEPFDLLLLDKRMPSMSGVELLASIRSTCHLNCLTPAIVLAAEAQQTTRHAVEQAGFASVLEKSCTPHDLYLLAARLITAAPWSDMAPLL
jgi:CheY-like chemotaxis protein